MNHEQALISAFIVRGKRDRYREIITDPRLRHKFTHKLAHFADFEPQYRLPFESSRLFIQNTATELQKRHSPGTLYVISEDPRLDGQSIPLMNALKKIVGRGVGSVVSCLPGRLAFVETEDERSSLNDSIS